MILMISELQLTVLFNGYSPILLKAAYYMSLSVYLMIFLTALRAAKNGKDIKRGLYALAAISAVAVIGYILKQLFNVSRPSDINLKLIDIKTDPSFPSGHASESFVSAALSKSRLFYLWALLISVSRLILGVHYLSDIVAGALLGYVIGKFASKHEKIIYKKFLEKKNIFETRRQLAHGAIGVAISAFVLYEPSTIAPYALFASVVAIFLLMRLIKKKIHIPLVSKILNIFERKKDMQKFPLKGTLFFMTGSLMAASLYAKPIAAAAIVILALGDSFSTLVGRPFGKTKLIHNPKKSLEGSIAGFVAAFAGALFIASPKIAFIGALSGMVVESIDSPVDDNFTIPVVCGALMALF